MKTLLLIIFTSLYFSSFAQVERLSVDTLKWENGKVKSIERYLESKKYRDKRDINNRHGQWIDFYESGELEATRFYAYGSQDSTITYYYKNGNKKEQGILKPWPVGIWTTWYTNGTKQSEGIWDNIKRLDAWKFWDSTGQLTSEVFYTDSSYKSTFYNYENGKLKSIEKWKGPYFISAPLFFYDNKIKQKEKFEITRDISGDCKHFPRGTWQLFDLSGNVTSEEVYGE